MICKWIDLVLPQFANKIFSGTAPRYSTWYIGYQDSHRYTNCIFARNGKKWYSTYSKLPWFDNLQKVGGAEEGKIVKKIQSLSKRKIIWGCGGPKTPKGPTQLSFILLRDVFPQFSNKSSSKKTSCIPVLLKKHSERISDQWSVINKYISNISKPCGVDFCLECNQICGLCEGTGCNQVGPGPNCQHHPPFLLTGCGGEGKRRHPNKQQNNRNENMPKKSLPEYMIYLAGVGNKATSI